MTADTLFADVSEFQPVVNDSYLYQVLSIRVSDGTYRDHHFAANYAWMRRALDSGKLVFGIVYTYCRPSWQHNANTVRSMIEANGGLHPRVALMLDVEQGGNPRGDGSDWINRLYWNLADYTGNRARIIGYGNIYDLDSMWGTKPSGIRIIVAAYGANPDYPGKVAHQYTDGQGYGGELPEGAPPFGNCDMNSADASPTCGRHAEDMPTDSTPTAVVPRWLRLVLISDRAGSSWYVGMGFFFAPVLALVSPWPTVTAVLWVLIALAGLWLGVLGIAMATGLAMVLRTGAEIPEEYWWSILDQSPPATARARTTAAHGNRAHVRGEPLRCRR